MATVRFNEDDLAVLREVVRRVLGDVAKLGRSQPAPDRWEDYMTPDVYIAKVPVDGIPALTDSVTTGTGTGTFQTDPKPGMAACDIYQLQKDGSSNYRLFLMDLEKEEVFNLSTQEISGGTFVTLCRDKFGRWIAQVSAVPVQVAIAKALVNETGGVEVTDTTFGISSFSMIQGTNPGSVPTSCSNFLKVPAEDGDNVLLLWDSVGEQWLGIPAHYSTLCIDPCGGGATGTGTP